MLRGAKRIAEEKRREEDRQGWHEGELSQEEFEENAEPGADTGYDRDEEYDEDWGELREEELEREHKFELFTIPREVIAEYNLPKDLPDGVAIMGGTARSIARRMVTGDKEPVRDLDLVFIPELADIDNPPSDEELDHLSAKYMADDYAHGHGIGTDNLEDYFDGRDFTVNQCLVAGNKLLMTRAAYDDFQENIIRPSFREQTYDNEPTTTRQLMRALLLQSVVAGFSSSYPTLEDFCTNEIDQEIEENFNVYDIRLRPFEVAITMNKALSRGAETANRFTNNLVDWDIVTSDYANEPLHLARKLHDNCYNFEFRPGDGPLGDEPLDYRSLEEEFNLGNFQTNDPELRAAMREYDSHDIANPYRNVQEKMAGRYAKGDYDWVNRQGEFDTSGRYDEDNDDDWY